MDTRLCPGGMHPPHLLQGATLLLRVATRLHQGATHLRQGVTHLHQGATLLLQPQMARTLMHHLQRTPTDLRRSPWGIRTPSLQVRKLRDEEWRGALVLAVGKCCCSGEGCCSFVSIEDSCPYKTCRVFSITAVRLCLLLGLGACSLPLPLPQSKAPVWCPLFAGIYPPLPNMNPPYMAPPPPYSGPSPAGPSAPPPPAAWAAPGMPGK